MSSSPLPSPLPIRSDLQPILEGIAVHPSLSLFTVGKLCQIIADLMKVGELEQRRIAAASNFSLADQASCKTRFEMHYWTNTNVTFSRDEHGVLEQHECMTSGCAIGWHIQFHQHEDDMTLLLSPTRPHSPIHKDRDKYSEQELKFTEQDFKSLVELGYEGKLDEFDCLFDFEAVAEYLKLESTDQAFCMFSAEYYYKIEYDPTVDDVINRIKSFLRSPKDTCEEAKHQYNRKRGYF